MILQCDQLRNNRYYTGTKLVLYIYIYIYIYIYKHKFCFSIVYIYIYIYIYILSSLSSSCCAISTDIPGHLSPPLLIVHCFQQVFRTTSRIYTEKLCVGSRWPSNLCSALWRGPQEFITYELIPTSPAVSRMSSSSNFDSFRDGWWWLYSCCFVGFCLQDLLNIAGSILV